MPATVISQCSRWANNEQHISTWDLKATVESLQWSVDLCVCMCVYVCVLTPLCSVSLISLQRGKNYIGSPCLRNTLGLSNLCCSETSHSISSVDRCHCSLSPLGADSFRPASLRLVVHVRPLQIHQVSHLLQTTEICFTLIQRSEGLIINIQTVSLESAVTLFI